MVLQSTQSSESSLQSDASPPFQIQTIQQPIAQKEQQDVGKTPHKKFLIKIVVISLCFVVIIVGAFIFQYQKGGDAKKVKNNDCLKKIGTAIDYPNEEANNKLPKKLLLENMDKQTNYQLEIRRTIDTREVQVTKILRDGDNFAVSYSNSSISAGEISYFDIDKCKLYTFFQKTNEYVQLIPTQQTSTNIPNQIIPLARHYKTGTPRGYLEIFTGDLSFKGQENIGEKTVDVYNGTLETNKDLLVTVYIDNKTSLPLKIVSTTNKIKSENTDEFMFSRVGEISKSEVSLPLNAKKLL